MAITAGIDVSYDGNRYGTALVTFCDEKLERIKTDEGELNSPYVSKLFFLREAPVLSRVLFGEAIDLLFVNGHGVCHPYFFGLATVVGWTHNIATIGVAAKLIRGDYQRLPSRHPGVDFISMRCQVVGAAIRLEKFTRPLFISPGFGISLDQAVSQYLHWVRVGKLPEPLRLAHLEAHRLVKRVHAQP